MFRYHILMTNIGVLGIEDDKSAEKVEDFFKGISLPLPAPGEYFHASNYKRLVFLSDFGLLISIIRYDKAYHFDRPNALMSLFNRKAGRFDINIFPGAISPVSDDDVPAIRKTVLEVSGLSIEDPSGGNFAYIPGTDPLHPVIIDFDMVCDHLAPDEDEGIMPPAPAKANTVMDRIKRLIWPHRVIPERTETIKKEPQKVFGYNPQVELYQPLRSIIASAWPVDKEAPDKDGIVDFFRTASSFQSAGKLVSAWDQNPHKNINAISCRYGEKIRRSSDVNALII